MQETPTLNTVMTAALKAVRESDWSNWQLAPGDTRLTTPWTADQPPLTNRIFQSYVSVCAWVWQRPIAPAEQERASDGLRRRWAVDTNYLEQYRILSFGFVPAILQTMTPEQQEMVRTELSRELPDGVFPGVDTAPGTFPGIDATVSRAVPPAGAVNGLPVRRLAMNDALLGSWVQDESGPVTTYSRRYQFNNDGSYEFVLTSRQRGSMNQQALAGEEGTFTVEGDQLVISPTNGNRKAVTYSVEKDKFIGNTQLVMTLQDGQRDIYYPSLAPV
jgi:hypothetical protein